MSGAAVERWGVPSTAQNADGIYIDEDPGGISRRDLQAGSPGGIFPFRTNCVIDCIRLLLVRALLIMDIIIDGP